MISKTILNNRFFLIFSALLVGLALGWFSFRDSGGHVHTEGEGGVEEAKIYTCSMHPQIRQDGPGKCPLCGMELIPLTSQSGTGSTNPYVHSLSGEAVALANIQTFVIDSTAPQHEISLSGKIAVNEQNLAVITANFSGRIEKLFIDFTGQQVSKGQKLATVYSPDLITAQKELLEAAGNKEANPVLYRAVREKLRLWKIDDRQIAAIEASGEVKAELDIHADVAGVVIKRGYSTGDFVGRGDVLFEIADLSRVWVQLDAYESDIPLIKVGDKIEITVASFPGRIFSAKVNFVDPLVNPQSRTAAVRAEIGNPDLALKPDMFINAKVKVKQTSKEKSLLIPKSALLWTGKRSIVYVDVTDGEYPAFELRELTLGARSGDYYAVVAGLNPGEKVVANGVFAIDAAAQLSGNYSMMNRPADSDRSDFGAVPSQWAEIVDAYLDVKNRLVESDFGKAAIAARKLSELLKNTESSPLQGSVASIIAAKDLDAQRRHFGTLSDSLIAAVEIFGVKNGELFINHCPMALGDKGAHWLSEFEEVKNPYYGESMLNCGDVVKKFSPSKEPKEKGLPAKGSSPSMGHFH